MNAGHDSELHIHAVMAGYIPAALQESVQARHAGDAANPIDAFDD